MRKCIYLALFTALVTASPRAHAFSFTGNLAPASTISADGGLPGLIAGGTMLDVYEIVFHSDSAADVTAFDLFFTGTFAQVQLGDGFGGNIGSPILPSPGGVAGEAQDTHIVPSLTIPAGFDPTEGIITFGNTGTGFADGLSSNKVAIAGADQAPDVLVAQIVMLQGATGSFSGEAAVQGFSDPFIIPLTMIGSGGPPPTNTPPVFVDDFPGEAAYDQHTLATRVIAADYQMKGTDVEDGNDANLEWTLNSFAGPYGINGITMLPGAGNGNQTLSSMGLFEWDPGTFADTSRGYYFAGITVTDSMGATDMGILRVQVPEPSTLILAGLSLVGIFASRRRKS